MVKLNMGFIWMIILLGVGNSRFADGHKYYKCKFYDNNHEYTCGVLPTSLNTEERHEINKSDRNVNAVKFDGNSDTISNLTPDKFPVCQRFHNLQEIYIKWITSINANFFYDCDDLKILDIQDTEIKEIPVNLLNENSKLTDLHIHGSKLTTLPENMFINQQELVKLHLHQNQLTSLPANIFKPLKKLKNLWLQGNKIQSLIPEWFEKLSNLATLDLSHNQIEKLPQNVFGSLKNLENLILMFNKLTVIKSESFGILQKLTQLELFANRIEAIDEKLIDNTEISMIDMTGNVCSQDDIQDRDEIKESLMECFENYESTFNFECGKPKITYSQAIRNGNLVRHGQFSWIAALILKTGQFFCGGILISDTLVLTVAHCINGKQDAYNFTKEDFAVTLGAYNLSKTSEPGRITVKVKSINIHSDWNTDTSSYDADIAILELEEKIKFSKYIQPVCVPKPGTEPASQTLGNVVGRGGHHHTGNFDVARLLSTPIHSNKKCSEDRDFLDFISVRTFCGGYADGTGVCIGDNGGGLTVVHEGRHYLCGIVSSSLLNPYLECDQNRYSIYTDVLKFYDWITNRTEYENLSPNLRVITQNQLAVKQKWNLQDNGYECGKVTISRGLIFGGNHVRPGQYPWIAALMLKDKGFFCGGTLISKKLVVTAAHCIDTRYGTKFDPEDIYVLLGAHNISTRFEIGRITASVKAFHVHPDWNPNSYSIDANIAIVELDQEVIFTRYIQPICIAQPGTEVANKTLGYVTGFGLSERRHLEDIAKFIMMPIISYRECVKIEQHQMFLSYRSFCGGYANGTGVCDGDSGSGLIVVHEGRHYLRGIVSSSLINQFMECDTNEYSMFTDILRFYDWVTTGKDD